MQQPEEQQRLIPGTHDLMDLHLTVFQTLGKIYTLLRGMQLPEHEVFEQRRDEEAIQKALVDYQGTLPLDQIAARNFLFMIVRDVAIGIMGYLLTAELRRTDTTSIANILIVAFSVAGVLVAVSRHVK